MIGFIVGALVGGTLGVTTMCLCSAASEADRHIEELSEREEIEREL